MTTHYKQKSLNEIISSINAGLVDFKDSKKLTILSQQYPGFIIQIVEVDLTEHIAGLVGAGIGIIPKDVDMQVEMNAYDYFVFSIDENEEGEKTLVNIPLFELVIAAGNLLADDSGQMQTTNNQWDMSNPIWDCIEQD